MLRSRSAEQGQATVDYLVLVAIVVAVLGVGALAAAPGLANTVVEGLRHALCVVGGGECVATAPPPCVVRSDATDESITVKAAIVRFGHSAGILREDLSDGSVNVTEIDDVDLGAEVGLDAKGRLAVGPIDVAAGGGISAVVAGWLGHTRMFHVADRRAADRLIDRLTHHSPTTIVVDLPIRLIKGALGLDRHDGIPAADEVTFAGGGEVSSALAPWSASLRASVGGIWDRKTGQRTYFLQLEGGAQAQLRAALGVAGGGSVLVGVRFSRDRKPLKLSVNAVGRGDLSRLPYPLPARASGRVEVDASLDLTVPEAAAAARRLLAALQEAHAGAAAIAARDLGRRLMRDGGRDVRVYSTASTSQGAGGEIGVGLKVGADVSLDSSTARLLAAWSRPPGGVWEKRADCLARNN